MNNVISVLLLLWFHNTRAQTGLQCFVPGECLDSQILAATPTNNSRDCWRHCQNVTGCTWFTFYKDSKICTPLSGCLRLSNEKSQDNCISGEEECPEVQCGVHGRCYGALEGIRKVGSAKECGTICERHQECFWNTYDPDHESCLMTNDCPLLDRSCANCSSSERNCLVENSPEFVPANKKSVNLIGTSMKLSFYSFNMETKTASQCQLSLDGLVQPIVQYTTFDNQLHACADGKADGEIAVVCSRFDRDKKIWTLVDNVKIAAGQFLYFLSLPSGRILIMSKSQFVYVYDGHEIITASSRFPFSASVFQTPFCRTAVSEDEILIGFAPVKLQNNKLGVADKLYSFRVNNTILEVIKIEVPNLKLVSSLCGAFGPEENRKVAIFGGKHFLDDEPGDVFKETLILDWNSKKFETNGPSLIATIPSEDYGQTIAFGDTFLLYIYNKFQTKIFKFDINGTETKMPFVGSIPDGCLNLATVPSDIPGCM